MHCSYVRQPVRSLEVVGAEIKTVIEHIYHLNEVTNTREIISDLLEMPREKLVISAKRFSELLRDASDAMLEMSEFLTVLDALKCEFIVFLEKEGISFDELCEE